MIFHIIFDNHMNHLICILIPLVVNTAREPDNNQIQFITSCNWNNCYGIIISAIIEYLFNLKFEVMSANVQFIQILTITPPLFFSHCNIRLPCRQFYFNIIVTPVAFHHTFELIRDKEHNLVMNERQWYWHGILFLQ